MVFGLGKKKKKTEEKEELTRPALGPPADLSKPPAEDMPPHFERPFGGGITEPPHVPEETPSRPSAPRSFEKLPSRPQPEPQQNDQQLILAKLETIKAQLDFLQQKFERIEQYLKKEDTIRWR